MNFNNSFFGNEVNRKRVKIGIISFILAIIIFIYGLFTDNISLLFSSLIGFIGSIYFIVTRKRISIDKIGNDQKVSEKLFRKIFLRIVIGIIIAVLVFLISYRLIQLSVTIIMFILVFEWDETSIWINSIPPHKKKFWNIVGYSVITIFILSVSTFLIYMYFIPIPNFSELEYVSGYVTEIETIDVRPGEERIEFKLLDFTPLIIYDDDLPKYNEIKSLIFHTMNEKTYIEIWVGQSGIFYDGSDVRVWQLSNNGEEILSYNESYDWKRNNQNDLLYLVFLFIILSSPFIYSIIRLIQNK